MTKAEELKVLGQICELIKSTGTDSYISMAFRGVPEYAERNIAEDAGYNPVEERDMWEKRCYDKDCQLQKQSDESGKLLLRVEHERDVYAEQLKQSREAYEEKHQMWCKATDAVSELRRELDQTQTDARQYRASTDEVIDRQDAEIMRLKAEIYDLRKERDR